MSVIVFSPDGLFCLGFALAVLLLLKVTNSSVAIGSLLEPSALIFSLAGLHLVYTRWRPEPILGSLTSGLLAVTWSALAAGFVALVGLRMNAPLIDAELASTDAILHVNTPAIVAWFADQPLASHVLDIAYRSAVPIVFGCIVYLALTRNEIRVRELVFAFLGCITTCACLSAIIPAEGAFAHYGIPVGITARLPTGSGLYHLPIFNSYRSGNLSIIDLRHLSGLVTFPSFHTCMALMVAHAMRDTPWLSRFAWLWACVVLVSTIPIGGHYAADVVAGAVLWSAFALAGARRGAPRSGPEARDDPRRC